MKKIFTLVLASIIISIASYAQSISPNENTEFCPLTNTTFTVTLPRIATGTTPTVSSWTNTPILISGVNNINHTATQTTFTFVGQFRDVNINQVFRVDYVPSGGSATFYEFKFKRVKSLFYSSSCTQIQPNTNQINAPRCQITNIPISFSNIQWSTAFESPTLCFGSISTYEYQLPNGWSIGTNVSNGSNWIAGGNSVTITSDLSNGINGNVFIRPVNSCGTGLTNGQAYIKSIPISRPAPTLSITGGLDVICTGNSTYSISGLTNGATVSWAISNPSIATIPSPSTGNSVTVTQVGTGVVTLTATVTDCIQTYTPVTKQITLGVPPIDKIIVQGQRFNYTPNGPLLYYTVCANESIDLFPNVPFPPNQITTNEWQWLSGGYGILGATNYFGLYVYTSSTIRNVLELRYRYTNACGTSGWQNVSVESMDCDNGEEPYRVNPNKNEKELKAATSLSIYPNPVQSNLIVNIADNNPKGFLSLFDMNGKQIYQAKVTGQRNLIGVSSFSNGIYLLKIIVNGKTETKKIIISK